MVDAAKKYPATEENTTLKANRDFVSTKTSRIDCISISPNERRFNKCEFTCFNGGQR